MSAIMQGRCPHNLNPVACLRCFHAPKATAVQAAKPLPWSPNGVPIGELPTRAPTLNTAGEDKRIGEAVSGHAQVTPEERAKHRGEKLGQVAQQVPRGEAGPAMREAYSSATPEGAYNGSTLVELPQRKSIIDSLPRHPQAK
jgi:hypothetical protein